MTSGVSGALTPHELRFNVGQARVRHDPGGNVSAFYRCARLAVLQVRDINIESWICLTVAFI